MNSLALNKIYRLEDELLKQPQVEMPITHEFCNGLYARTMFIPKHTVLTGAIHRHDSFFCLRKGRLIVTTQNGSPKLIESGFMCVTKSGEKRAICSLDDCLITTFHANTDNEQDEFILWGRLTIPKYEHLVNR
jgi:hypothetical protein